MSKKLEDEVGKSKISAFFFGLFNHLPNLKLKTKQTASLGVKSEIETYNEESEFIQEKNNSNCSKNDVCDSIERKKYSSLNDTRSSKLCEDPILQKYEVKDKSLNEHLKSKKAFNLHNNKEIEAPIIHKNEVKLNNVDTSKSPNIQSESKCVLLFDSSRCIKSEPVEVHDSESEISWKNKFKDSYKLLNGHSNHQNITCLENRNFKDERTDKVDCKYESESEDENIIERGPDKTPKNKTRHSEYPPRERNQETAVTEISQNVPLHEDFEKLNLDIEIERIIADIQIEERIAIEKRIADTAIEKHIAKIKVDEEITNFLYNLFGANNNFISCTDSISNPAINSQELKTEARYKLFVSEKFSKNIFFEECLKMGCWIQGQEFVSNGHEVIHYFKLYGRKKYRRTNLHDAVMNNNLEQTLCILEIQKWFDKEMLNTVVNAKDSSNPKKTALDWAYEIRNFLLNSGQNLLIDSLLDRNSLLIDYLKENLATRAVHITPISPPGN